MTQSHPTPAIGATVHGFPRIGRDRQLKFALEAYWSEPTGSTAQRLDHAAKAVRLDALYTMSGAGLDTFAVNTFSWYDQMLDASVLLGAIPHRFAGIDGDHRTGGISTAQYFAMARGTADIAPLEMTKWFDTNYHYLVPEIGPDTEFALDPTKLFDEFEEAKSRGYQARPVLPGPWTYLSLAKAAEDAPQGFTPLDRLADLLPVYRELLELAAARNVRWLQLDEPALVHDLAARDVDRIGEVYAALSGDFPRPALHVSTYFGAPVEALPALTSSSVEAIGLDLTRGVTPELVAAARPASSTTLVLGAVDGRNVWRTDLTRVLGELRGWGDLDTRLAVSSSCSLLHVPYNTRRENAIDPALREQLAFADQKLTEIVALQRALDGQTDLASEAFEASDAAVARRADVPGRQRPAVQERAHAVEEADRHRADRTHRRAAQQARLGLPLLPTTTIGSFPQTAEVRQARARFRAGAIDETSCVERMHEHIDQVLALQTRLNLDVLVHGEPERNDMVQYFAENLDGFAVTQNGWVQSYGSRCTRPSILWGDVSRPKPITVDWTTYTQSLTDKPVKGMLTGPVTILAWSFVRDDQPLRETANQVALALRDEIADLEAAGIAVIQVDEPALRELLPLREADHADYLDWSVKSFRLATAGVRPDTQIHTHLCYSEFGQIMGAIDGLDADVTSIEAARSKMEIVEDIAAAGYPRAVGPGVYDIHSPRVPSVEEITELLTGAVKAIAVDQLWVNPDCGLKTRRYAETTPSLEHMLAATREVRATL